MAFTLQLAFVTQRYFWGVFASVQVDRVCSFCDHYEQVILHPFSSWWTFRFFHVFCYYKLPSLYMSLCEVFLEQWFSKGVVLPLGCFWNFWGHLLGSTEQGWRWQVFCVVQGQSLTVMRCPAPCTTSVSHRTLSYNLNLESNFIFCIMSLLAQLNIVKISRNATPM